MVLIAASTGVRIGWRQRLGGTDTKIRKRYKMSSCKTLRNFQNVVSVAQKQDKQRAYLSMKANSKIFFPVIVSFLQGKAMPARLAGLLAALIVFLSGCTGAAPVVTHQAGPLPAQHGMVVSAQQEASKAGVEVLRKGGNAVDAAVATGFALAVVFPVAGNLGGGGFMVIRLADGKTTTIDYREKAPAAAARTMFLDSTGNFVPALSQRGYLASGVPGSVAGLLKVHDQYGRLPLGQVMAPAIRLARDGYILSRREADYLNAFAGEFRKYAGTARYFTKKDGGGKYREGERFVQRDLSRVLQRIEQQGRAGFYEGRTADLIVAEMERGGGLITHNDLKAYEAIERPPVTGVYRGYRVVSMGPPSSGGIALIQLLNAVEAYDLQKTGYQSSQTVHLMSEAMRRVYVDRAEWLGDPDFVEVPTDVLIGKPYMQTRMSTYDPDRATPSKTIAHGNPLAYESSETTHYSVVDVEGNAVSATTTINGAFGSGVVVDGAGFFLNNEMDDFSAKPGTPNMFGLVGSEANAIQPGKRMLSSMTPTVVEDPKGRLLMVIGTPGGSTIITTVFQTIVNVVDYDMDIQEAVNAPRFHHQWLPDVLEYEPLGLSLDVVRNLERRGWTVSASGGPWGRADGILVEHSRQGFDRDESGLEWIDRSSAGMRYYGGADRRGEDTAAGY